MSLPPKGKPPKCLSKILECLEADNQKGIKTYSGIHPLALWGNVYEHDNGKKRSRWLGITGWIYDVTPIESPWKERLHTLLGPDAKWHTPERPHPLVFKSLPVMNVSIRYHQYPPELGENVAQNDNENDQRISRLAVNLADIQSIILLDRREQQMFIVFRDPRESMILELIFPTKRHLIYFLLRIHTFGGARFDYHGWKCGPSLSGAAMVPGKIFDSKKQKNVSYPRIWQYLRFDPAYDQSNSFSDQTVYGLLFFSTNPEFAPVNTSTRNGKSVQKYPPSSIEFEPKSNFAPRSPN